MHYFLGLDNGGTVTKAALFTSTGKEVCNESVETEMLTPHVGFSERDMDAMWDANCHLIHRLITKHKIDPTDIKGVSVCGHGKGLYLWGKDDKPARNGIISTDNRAWALVEQWKEAGVEGKVLHLSAQHILPSQPVALLAWLKTHEPETYQNILWVFECKDYIRFRLTGKPMAEITDYSGANFLNLFTRTYDRKLLELFGIPEVESALPPLCTATQICGTITEESAKATGLIAGTPVAGGMFDIDACAVAVNVINEDHVCMIAGTWSINEYIRKTPVTDGAVLMNSLFCLPEYYLVEECSPTSAGNFEWLIRTWFPELVQSTAKEGDSIYRIMNQWVESIPPGEFCPIFLPFLMASNVHPNAKGSFVGASNYHTRNHFVRSVYEGIAFSHRYHLEKLLATRNQPVAGIRLAGGVAKSKVWTQMFADVMQLPIEVADVNEAGALGCAMAAAVATGEYRDLPAAAAAMCALQPPVLPNPENLPIYQQKYALYRKVIDGLSSVWNDMQVLIEAGL
ncbi:MAG: carbohydrate kinase [Anaerolineae bacterium]|nr:carbohydrate kinase [Anaerolineae bacterium]